MENQIRVHSICLSGSEQVFYLPPNRSHEMQCFVMGPIVTPDSKSVMIEIRKTMHTYASLKSGVVGNLKILIIGQLNAARLMRLN